MEKKVEKRTEFTRYELYILYSYLGELKGIRAGKIAACSKYSAAKKNGLREEIKQIESLREVIDNKVEEMLKEVI